MSNRAALNPGSGKADFEPYFSAPYYALFSRIAVLVPWWRLHENGEFERQNNG